MKAVDQELGMVHTRERRLLIPTYQRDYEWTEDGQWQLLADDILGVTTRAFEADLLLAGVGTSSADRLGPHFLGAIVFSPSSMPATEVVIFLLQWSYWRQFRSCFGGEAGG